MSISSSSESKNYVGCRCCCRCRPRPITQHTRLPVELVQEILTWLPAKSLMRFKSVSRIWRSIILDPAFAQVHQHRGAFEGLLFSNSIDRRYAPETDFYYMPLEGPTNQISHLLTLFHGDLTGSSSTTDDQVDDGTYMGSTGQVNGLVCFYHENHSYLYNIATRESLQLPDSVNESEACSYHLGFDPVNQLYKLVKICPIYKGRRLDYEAGAVFLGNSNCEILTFGEGKKEAPLSWRIMDSQPPPQIVSRSLCYNGLLYWMEKVESSTWRTHLIAFDLSEERFFLLPTPYIDTGCYLTGFGPGPSIYHSYPYLDDYLDDYSYPMKIISYHHCKGGAGAGEPVSYNIVFNRRDLEEDTSIMGILPDGKVLIFRDPHSINFPDFYRLYDSSKRAFEIKVISRITYSATSSPSSASSADPLKSLEFENTSYYRENIVSLRSLI